jgi:hypothetical protein
MFGLNCSDARVRIVKGGTIGSTDKASGSAWPGSDAYETYGSSSDLWGETWTDSDINDSGFGMAIAASGTCEARIDHIEITVHYTEAPADDAVPRGPLVSTIHRLFSTLYYRTFPVFNEAIPVPEHIPWPPAIYIFRTPPIGTARIRVRATGPARQYAPQLRRGSQVYRRWTRFPRIAFTTIASPPLRQANPLGTVYRYWQGYLTTLNLWSAYQPIIYLQALGEILRTPPGQVKQMRYDPTIRLRANAQTTVQLRMNAPPEAEEQP